MDLREKKTKRSIKKAFIELRSNKPLERITVKELVELAEISKATFYLHYHDIFDLSDSLQKELIQDILKGLDQPELFLTNTTAFTSALFYAFAEHQELIEILFSGSQYAILPLSIEKEVKEYIFKIIPSARDDAKFNIMLTHQILGGYHVYQQYHEKHSIDYIMDVLKEITNTPYPPLSKEF